MNDSLQQANESRNEALPKKSWGPSIVGISVVLAIYILSTGPVCCLSKQGKIPDSTVMVYMPLIAFSEAIPPINDFFDWYVKLWLPSDEE